MTINEVIRLNFSIIRGQRIIRNWLSVTMINIQSKRRSKYAFAFMSWLERRTITIHMSRVTLTCVTEFRDVNIWQTSMLPKEVCRPKKARVYGTKEKATEQRLKKKILEFHRLFLVLFIGPTIALPRPTQQKMQYVFTMRSDPKSCAPGLNSHSI